MSWIPETLFSAHAKLRDLNFLSRKIFPSLHEISMRNHGAPFRLDTTLIAADSFGIKNVFAVAVIATIFTITGGLASVAVRTGAAAGGTFAVAVSATTTTAAVRRKDLLGIGCEL
ncbi:hypothetical protein [Burkholderia ubonensis]|uniref:hypothetical protein n=1 Tax=Burkholderia ubonensis TaxID=101571 RepID=UPI0012F91CFC|nr:hypothetical protein [Burkholderia ubonensis]